jgi:hypothetical protein
LKEALIKLGKIVVRSCLLSNHRFEQERLKRADDLRKRAAMLHARLGGRAELPSDFPETSGESSGEVGAQVSEKTNDFNGADDQASRVTNNHKPIAKKERKKDMSPDQLSLMPGDPPKVGVVKEAQRLYNEVAKRCGIPQSRVVNPKLEKDIRLRLDEIGGLDGWREALSRVEASSFLRGKNNRGWKATIDFLAQPSSMAKLMNGAYRADMGTVAADGPAGGEPVFRYAREAFSGDFSKVPLSMRIMVENDERMKRGEELLPEPAECG